MMKHEKSESEALEGFSIVSAGFRQDVFLFLGCTDLEPAWDRYLFDSFNDSVTIQTGGRKRNINTTK